MRRKHPFNGEAPPGLGALATSAPASSTPADDGDAADGAQVDWRTKTEIAAHFKCNVRTITNYMQRGMLPYVKVGRWLRFDRRECDAAIKKLESVAFGIPRDE